MLAPETEKAETAVGARVSAWRWLAVIAIGALTFVLVLWFLSLIIPPYPTPYLM